MLAIYAPSIVQMHALGERIVVERGGNWSRPTGNGFRLFEPFLRPPGLPPVATGCDRSAP